MPRVDILIAHAAWDESRKPALDRLCKQLLPFKSLIVSSTVKEHASVWSRRLYEVALSGEHTHFVFLNDDVEVCPDFASVVGAIVETVPDEVISLHTVCPRAKYSDSPWLRSYLLSGPGYIYPRADLEDRIAFEDKMPARMRARMNEDEIGAHHAWQRQKPIWQTVPALVKHDTSIPSTLGYDHHPMRESPAPFGFRPMPKSWKVDAAPEHVPHPWLNVAQLERVRKIIATGGTDLCVWCEDITGRLTFVSEQTGARICTACVSGIVGHVFSQMRAG